MLTRNDLLPVRIRLDDDDIRTGFEFEVEMARLLAKVEMIQQMRAGHAAQMREKYGAGAEYKIDDWLTGFELIGDANYGE